MPIRWAVGESGSRRHRQGGAESETGADAPELGVSRPVHQKARVPSTGMRVPLTVS